MSYILFLTVRKRRYLRKRRYSYFLPCFVLLGWMNAYKFHRKDHEIGDASLFSKLHTEAFINHCITTPLTAYGLYSVARLFLYSIIYIILFSFYLVLSSNPFLISFDRYFGTPLASEPLPEWQNMAIVFCGAHLFNDVGFYWTHRLFHAKVCSSLYIYISQYWYWHFSCFLILSTSFLFL